MKLGVKQLQTAEQTGVFYLVFALQSGTEAVGALRHQVAAKPHKTRRAAKQFYVQIFVESLRRAVTLCPVEAQLGFGVEVNHAAEAREQQAVGLVLLENIGGQIVLTRQAH